MVFQEQEKLYTVDDLWELVRHPENQDKRFELSEGRLISMSPASWEHGGLAMELGYVVTGFVKENHLGMTTAAETGYILYKNPDLDGKDTVRAPDVGFIAASRMPVGGLPAGYVPFAPDLAIEVISPEDSADEVQKKVAEYLQYGTQAIWLFYPKSKTVGVYTAPSHFETLGINDTLDGGTVLPGFRLAVRDIFK